MTNRSARTAPIAVADHVSASVPVGFDDRMPDAGAEATRFTIDRSATQPPSEQLRCQVVERVRSGALPAGTRLLPVRRLAEELGLAANTVARSYRELEADGVIETRGRNGSFIAAHGDPIQQQAQLAAREFAERIRRLDVSPETALALASAALHN